MKGLLRKQKVTDPNFGVTNNNAIDIHVGRRVRQRRTLFGYSQEQLSLEMNITFQQVQKYERGSNRISASRLWDISQILEVDIGYFFEDMSRDTKAQSPRSARTSVKRYNASPIVKDPMARRETLELVRSYYSIEKPHVRKRLSEMIKAVAQTMVDG